MRDAMNRMQDFAKSMDSVNVTSGGSVSYTPMQSGNNPALCRGWVGSPCPGELFPCSREDGPEMVGTIGGRHGGRK